MVSYMYIYIYTHISCPEYICEVNTRRPGSGLVHPIELYLIVLMVLSEGPFHLLMLNTGMVTESEQNT